MLVQVKNEKDASAIDQKNSEQVKNAQVKEEEKMSQQLKKLEEMSLAHVVVEKNTNIVVER